VLRHHRRVTAVEIGPDGVRVRSAAGATVQARAAVVAVGRRAADLLGLPVQPVQPGGTDGRPVRRFGPVLVAFGAGASGSAAARQLGELLADLTLHDLAGSAVPA
jgi:acetylornithine deacetylase/succinyl-diaminopimelate desuccinylase-like protein